MKKRVALVTGASRGIGRAIARALSADGIHVVGCSRRAVKTSDFDFQIADVTDGASIETLIVYIKKRYGRLDILVNNAGGLTNTGDFLSLTEEDWLDTFDLNVLGVLRVTKAAVPLLKKSSSARVVNIASGAAVMPSPFVPHYSSAKAAVMNLTKHMSERLAKHGILVNVVSPGPVDTGADVAPAWKKKQNVQVPLGRMGKPSEVATLVAFLCSEESSWITGANFQIDGGKARLI